MTYLDGKKLNIFYFSKRPEAYALYNLDHYYFVIFLNGGHGGGDRTVQITEKSFNELMSGDYKFFQIIDENIKLKSLNKTLNEYLFFSSSEPYILYQIENQYFIELWKKQRTGQSQAIEIDEKDLDKLFDEIILPSRIL